MKQRNLYPSTTALAIVLAAGIAGCSDGDGDSVPDIDPGILGEITGVDPGEGDTGEVDTGEGDSGGGDSGTGPDVVTPPADPVQPAELWRTGYEGTVIGRYALVGNDDLAVTVTRELRDQGFLTAVSPSTGEELWRVADAAYTSCLPVVLDSGDVVAHLDAQTVAGGEDSSNDLALIDGKSGAFKDTWEPGNGVLLNCGTGGLLATDSGLVIHAVRGVQTGLSTAGDTLEPLWTRNWSRDFDDDALSEGRSPSFYDPAVTVGTRLYMGADEDHADGFEDGVTLYRIDASTGAGVTRLELPLQSLSGIQVAGSGKLLITGQDKDRRDSTAILVGGASAETPDAPLVIDWTRTFDGNGDGVTAAPSAVSIALSEGAFASWSGIDAGATVTEFDLASGQANWSALTSSFSNNDEIVALPGGGYAVFPFGGNFLDAFDENGDPLWEIREIGERFDALGMEVLAGNIVMTGVTDEGWGFLGVGPLQ